LEAGMVRNELRLMYLFHRRNESSKPWRNRYTPRWKSLYKDGALRPGSRRGTIYSNATSQLDRPRATESRSSARLAPSSNPGRNYLHRSLYTGFVASIRPTRVAAPAQYDALGTLKYCILANHNSGGGRTEETRDRVNQQQIDRSRNKSRTRARGTEIAAGTTSADGWTTFPAERQVAAIEMRVGQNGGPLPSEAIIVSGKSIMESWKKLILAKENQGGGASNLFFRIRGTSIHLKGNGQIDERATFVWISVARDQRRERSKHQPTEVLRPSRVVRLSAGLEQRRGAQFGERATLSGVNVARDRRRGRSKHQLTTVLRPSGVVRLAERLEQRRGVSMEASATTSVIREEPRDAMEVEAEGGEVTRPVGEPMAAITL